MARQRVIGPDDPKYPAIRRRLFWTSIKTILGYLAMGGLVALALNFFKLSLSAIYGFGLIWVFLPVVMWWFSDKIALAMSKALPADPSNPEHKRVIDLVHEVWKDSGLKSEPPVYASPDERPNAFATGAIHRKAVVAFTVGLLKIGLTDDEIKAIFAHELSHVKHYDVAINSLLQVISSVLFMVVQTGVNAWLATIKIFLPKEKRENFVPGIVTSLIFYAIFWLVGQVTQIIQYFVVRSRESGADAGGALMTGKPCDLVTALETLVKRNRENPPKAGREDAYWRVMRTISTIDPLYDSLEVQPEPKGVREWVKRIWRDLHLTHPPVADRVTQLEKMNGGACERK
jgi:heat shock protein HtpX